MLNDIKIGLFSFYDIEFEMCESRQTTKTEQVTNIKTLILGQYLQDMHKYRHIEKGNINVQIDEKNLKKLLTFF